MEITPAHQQIQQMTYSDNPNVRDLAMALNNPLLSMDDLVRDYSHAMGVFLPHTPTNISPRDTAKGLDTFLSTIRALILASGFKVVHVETGECVIGKTKIEEVEGSNQDLTQIAECIGRMLVSAISFAAQYGLPLKPIIREVVRSDGTKMPIDGNPIVNACARAGEPGHVCNSLETFCALRDPSKETGEILAAGTYVPPNVGFLLERAGTFGNNTFYK